VEVEAQREEGRLDSGGLARSAAVFPGRAGGLVAGRRCRLPIATRPSGPAPAAAASCGRQIYLFICFFSPSRPVSTPPWRGLVRWPPTVVLGLARSWLAVGCCSSASSPCAARPGSARLAWSSFTWLVRALHFIDLSPAREVVDNRVEFGGGLAAAIERPLTRKNSAVLDLERNTGSCIWLGLPVLVRVPHGFGARRDVVGWSKPLPRFTGRHVWRAPSLSLSRLAHFLPAVLTTCGPLPVEP